jgi:hypothetical protein
VIDYPGFFTFTFQNEAKMKTTTYPILILSLLTMIACTNQSVQQTKKPELAARILTGNDRDSHGCIGSAGYTWSELRQECVRIFEIGSPFSAYGTNKDTTMSAFVILNNDKTKAEIYFPKDGKPIICDFVATPEGDIAPEIFRNKVEMVDIIFSRDFYYIRYQNNPIFTQKFTAEKGLWNMLKN